MNLLDLVSRRPPQPWVDGGKIPWEEAGFSARMLHIIYRQEDLRRAVFSEAEAEYDLAMLLYGEFNTFGDNDACALLTHACAALRPGGRLLLEPSTFVATQALGASGPSWYAAAHGLWSDRPFLCLQDNGWDAEGRVSVERYTLIDAESGAITQHAMTTRAYREDEVLAMLQSCGFSDIRVYPNMPGSAGSEQDWLYILLACKPI